MMVRKLPQEGDTIGIRFRVLACLLFVGFFASKAQQAVRIMEPLPTGTVNVSGVLGEAMTSSLQGRLKTFITSEESVPVSIFGGAFKSSNVSGDWYGEHVGKWMVAASKAAARTKDDSLKSAVFRVARFLIRQQEPDGYLNTYAPEAEARFSMADSSTTRTWDVWVHSYLILGFLEVYLQFGDETSLKAAEKIANLLDQEFGTGKKSIAMLGGHMGLSSTVVAEALTKLSLAVHNDRYARLAQTIYQQADARPGLQIMSKLLAGEDVQQIGTGKIYQICWNLVGLVRLFHSTGDRSYLDAAIKGWNSIRDYHLTPMGGPWGGIAGHKEVFNVKEYFNPKGFTETCSIMSWMQLTRELMWTTGEGVYADEYERSAWNALLGAQDANGSDWCYFSFPNGRRVNAYAWACCKSSGSVAVEELSEAVFAMRGGGIAINLFTPSSATVKFASGKWVEIVQRTDYPVSGGAQIRVKSQDNVEFPVFVHIPRWAKAVSIAINGKTIATSWTQGGYAEIRRIWKADDLVDVRFELIPELVTRSYEVKHRSVEVVKEEYVHFARGPLVYSTGLFDNIRTEETIQLPEINAITYFRPAATPVGFRGPAFELKLPTHRAMLFLPYFESGGRREGAWRTTWLSVVWQ